MVVMGPTGGGRRARVDNAAQALAEDSAYLEIVDLDAEEHRLSAEFAEHFVFTTIDYDTLSLSTPILTARRAIRFEDVCEEYSTLWAEMAIRKERLGSAAAIARRIVANKERYRQVEDLSRVPWYVVAVIHSLEASLNFRGHLHNGDPLDARTVHVPAGRPRNGSPPFDWVDSAVDALNYDGITGNADWSIERIAYLLESFNGWGYRSHHPEVKSPYLWSFSNQYSRGKYVADGKWSADAVSGQCGAMVILRVLVDTGEIRLQHGVVERPATAREGGTDFETLNADASGVLREESRSLVASFTEIVSDAVRIPQLIRQGSTAEGLKAARLEAARNLREYPHNGCAAHLSALLRQSGIDIAMTLGAGSLARKLAQRGWSKISVGNQRAGDVGVTFDLDPTPPGADHIYLVVGTRGDDEMQIADNQRMSNSPHERYASGRGGKTPTEYFLRAE